MLYLEHVAGQPSLPCVNQEQVLVQGLGKALQHRDLLHLHLQGQLGL